MPCTREGQKTPAFTVVWGWCGGRGHGGTGPRGLMARPHAFVLPRSSPRTRLRWDCMCSRLTPVEVADYRHHVRAQQYVRNDAETTQSAKWPASFASICKSFDTTSWSCWRAHTQRRQQQHILPSCADAQSTRALLPTERASIRPCLCGCRWQRLRRTASLAGASQQHTGTPVVRAVAGHQPLPSCSGRTRSPPQSPCHSAG